MEVPFCTNDIVMGALTPGPVNAPDQFPLTLVALPLHPTAKKRSKIALRILASNPKYRLFNVFISDFTTAVEALARQYFTCSTYKS